MVQHSRKEGSSSHPPSRGTIEGFAGTLAFSIFVVHSRPSQQNGSRSILFVQYLWFFQKRVKFSSELPFLDIFWLTPLPHQTEKRYSSCIAFDVSKVGKSCYGITPPKKGNILMGSVAEVNGETPGYDSQNSCRSSVLVSIAF